MICLIGVIRHNMQHQVIFYILGAICPFVKLAFLKNFVYISKEKDLQS